MKTTKFNLSSMLGLFIFLTLFSSCFTLGTALLVPEKADTRFQDDSKKIEAGWQKPDHKNVKLKLHLTNSREVSGTYKGEDHFKTGDEIFDFVLIETEEKLEKIPFKFISGTEILDNRRISKGTAILIGLGADIAIVAMLLAIEIDLFGG